MYDWKTKTYYMFYTAVTNGTMPSDLGDVKAMLSLAVNSGNPYSRLRFSPFAFRFRSFPLTDWLTHSIAAVALRVATGSSWATSSPT